MSGIKIITEPKIYVVGRQKIDQLELTRFLSDEGVPGWTTDASSDGEALAEIAGRLCYMSFAKPRPGGNAAYLGHILESGHGSVLEHEVFNLIVTGVSRSFTHELIRHRAGMSPSQLSQRYVDESDVAFVVPPIIQDAMREASLGHHWGASSGSDKRRVAAKEIVNIWKQSVTDASLMYGELSESLSVFIGHGDKIVRRKAAREAARSVLPNCTETKIFVTANARALRNILEQRGAPGADAEMRRFALALHQVLLKESPQIFSDYRVNELDGVTYLETEHRKV